jgi:hypothetical protein
MLDGKLRIAPVCYHVLHQVPVMVAHEMNYLYDEGLKTADGSLAYTISHDSMLALSHRNSLSFIFHHDTKGKPRFGST